MDTVALEGRCPRCGRSIPEEAPEGLCPRCVLEDAATATAHDSASTTAEGLDVPSLDSVRAAFPQLEILELIGYGGMGVVFKARQPKLDRLVALKLLPQSLGKERTFVERFNREARFLARLNHPNIVTVFDFGLEAGFCYLLMEYVDGVNLRQAMRAGRCSPAEALGIVPKICEALQYAHDQGVLHRDIKPENILLDGRGRLKIADFGIAKLVDDPRSSRTLTASGAHLGTPAYMAPEQIEKPSDVDHRADIYSLGVVFYEMLTGELPLGRFAAPSAKTSMDVRIDEIVLRALAKERELRQQSADEVKTQVEGINASAGAGPAIQSSQGFEYRSRRTLWGFPLLHVATGMDSRTGRPRVATGVLACGDVARGIVAIGGRAIGLCAFGGVAIGGFALGGLSLGIFAIGGIAISLFFAYGGLAVAPYAMGGMPVGFHTAPGPREAIALAMALIVLGFAAGRLIRWWGRKQLGLDSNSAGTVRSGSASGQVPSNPSAKRPTLAHLGAALVLFSFLMAGLSIGLKLVQLPFIAFSIVLPAVTGTGMGLVAIGLALRRGWATSKGKAYFAGFAWPAILILVVLNRAISPSNPVALETTPPEIEPSETVLQNHVSAIPSSAMELRLTFLSIELLENPAGTWWLAFDYSETGHDQLELVIHWTAFGTYGPGQTRTTYFQQEATEGGARHQRLEWRLPDTMDAETRRALREDISAKWLHRNVTLRPGDTQELFRRIDPERGLASLMLGARLKGAPGQAPETGAQSPVASAAQKRLELANEQLSLVGRMAEVGAVAPGGREVLNAELEVALAKAAINRDQKAAARARLEYTSKWLRIAEKMFEVGKLPQLELERARLDNATAQAALADAVQLP